MCREGEVVEVCVGSVTQAVGLGSCVRAVRLRLELMVHPMHVYCDIVRSDQKPPRPSPLLWILSNNTDSSEV